MLGGKDHIGNFTNNIRRLQKRLREVQKMTQNDVVMEMEANIERDMDECLKMDEVYWSQSEDLQKLQLISGVRAFLSEQQGLIIKWKKRGSVSLIVRCWKPFGHGDDSGNAAATKRECKDDLLWFRDIEKFAADDFSMAVVQTNQVLEDQS
ncbi:hypothetical protein JHK87_033859 [Glycine soja]|nr:hypothetical protein JHK87_033859 [Glycine soja]